MAKCQSLVRSRKVEVKVGDKVVNHEWRRLKEPEPCGEGCREYIVRKALRKPDLKKAEELKLFTLKDVQLMPTTSIIRTALCDRHAAKAKREGMHLVPVDGVENSYE